MFSKIKNILSEIVFPLILALVVLLLCFKNFSSGTWLTGWDNLHPEFNLKLDISRHISGIWQEYQDLGLLAGKAHVADLPRVLFLLPFSYFLPAQLLRYLWTFSMLLFGTLGSYYLISKVFLKEKNGAGLAGFCGALFYLLNLATVQYFYVPYESFTTFFGFLPWFTFFALRYFSSGLKKDLIFFLAVSVLGTPSFYVQTIFIVYLIFLGVFILETILESRLTGILRSIKLVFVTFSVNSFWLLPIIYLSLTHAGITSLSKINSIATPETQLMNQARGNFSDIAMLKGYWFDYYDFKPDGKFDYLYADWIEYLKNPMIGYLGLFLFGSVVAGLVFGIFNKNVRFRFALPILLVICYIMLATVNPPFGGIYKFLTDTIPLFSEFFRNVFTKWSGVASLVYAVGIGVFINSIIRFFGKFKSLSAPIIAALIFAVFAVTWPVFDGKLIYKSMRLNLPKEYFEMFNYFNSQPVEDRIAFFPLHTFWGWNYYDWEGNGSGFIWYGIKQPILDRAFDVWSPEGESFYSQMLLAIERNDLTTFEKTLEKYQVRYLLLDNSVIAPGGPKRNLNLEETTGLISKSNHIKKSQDFGFLKIYETDFDYGKKFVKAPFVSVSLQADLTYGETDSLYSRFGTYTRSQKAASFPFANLDKRGPVKISLAENTKLKLENEDTKSAILVPVNETIKEGFGTEQGYPEAKNCDLKGKGSAVKKRLDGKVGNFYGAYDGGVSCDYFYYPDINYDKDYLIRITGENIKGRSLKVYLENVVSKKIEQIELLPFGKFDEFIPLYGKHTPIPDESYPTGYNLSVETRSFGNIASENEVTNIQFYPVDFDYLANIKIGGEANGFINNLKINSVSKYGTWLYKIDVQGNGLIELGQGYDPGWTAWQIRNSTVKPVTLFEIRNLEHDRVNSWANGWMVPPNSLPSTIVIFFWPQLLEYLGFGILLATFIAILVSRKHPLLTKGE